MFSMAKAFAIHEHDIWYYYTSREFPIQNFHRRTTGIL